MDFENQIVPASVAGGTGATLTSAGETLHQGLEALVDLARPLPAGLDGYARLAWTWLADAEYVGTRFSSVPGFGTRIVTGNRLPYAPERLLTAALGYRHPRGFLAQAEVVRVSEQFGDDLNSVAPTADGQRGVLPAYTVWNLALSWDVRRLSVFATAKNVLDSLYVADRSRGMIPGPPRLVQVGIAARF
jgi:Fe(3+) dicitrate transport protein